MKGKSALLAGVAAIALVASVQAGYAAKKSSDATSAPAPAQAQTDTRYEELSQRIDALEEELQQAEMRSATDHEKVSSWKSASGWWDNTSISGRMYYDITYVSNKRNHASSNNDGTSFDIKRFYIGIDHKFNDIFSADVTTDFTYDSTAGASQLYLKKAYLEAKLDPAFVVRIGATDLPWVPFAEGVYGYRHIENTIADRTKFGTSSDWGVHFLGKLPGDIFSYQLSVISGVGYKKAGSTSFRSEHPDVEGRISGEYAGFTLAVGGYWGNLGAQKGDTKYNDATRFDALAAYKYEGLKVGVEYFVASNYNLSNYIKANLSSHATGVSPFASYQFDPQWSVFGRYDYVKPYSEAGKSGFHNDYFNVGIQYSPTKIVDFALVYKNDAGLGGNFGDANGTIGGTAFAAGNSGQYNEIGLFGQVRW
jgi:hypothetical protein